MTRKEAIELLKEYLYVGEDTQEFWTPFDKAINFAINSLETDEAYQLEYERTTKNDLAVDAVSRQEVLYLVGDYDLSMGQVVKGIHALPSVTLQEPRWIPTSERLPNEDGEYYAAVYDTDENYKYMDIAELEDGIWQYKDYVKVLAWMPLPEPYKMESEDNK